MDYMNQKLCALVGASFFDDEAFCARHYESVIAVDGGYEHLHNLGITPMFALGDFDSLGYVPHDVPCEQHPVAKDASDLALAIDYALNQGFDHIDIYGSLGGRADHTFATYQAMLGASRKGAQVRAFGEDYGVVLLRGSSQFSSIDLPTVPGCTFSVYSLSEISRGVDIIGVRYELHNGVLTNDTPLGLSNVTLAQSGHISVQEGSLLIFLPKEILAEL